MLTGGKAAAVVARQLGHASSQVTTGVYEHLLYDGMLDDALDVFLAQTLPSRAKRHRVRAGTLLEWRFGGVPERTNGAVLKTAGALTGARGFESHPRR
jgi:hypothetical protein